MLRFLTADFLVSWPIVQTGSSTGLSLYLLASLFWIITDRGAESEAKIDPKAVQEVLSGRARLQAGGLPPSAGPSSGGRPAPAVCPRSVSKSLAAGKRKGLEEEQQTAAQLPANKRARAESGGSVPAPAAQPGPAAARSSKLRGKQVLCYRPAGQVLPLSSTLRLHSLGFAFSFSAEGKRVEASKVPRQ